MFNWDSWNHFSRIAASFAFFFAGLSANAGEIPTDSTYFSHMPHLPALTAASASENPNPGTPTSGAPKPHRAESFFDKSPFTRIPRAYFELVKSLIGADRDTHGNYWPKLKTRANAALADTTGILGDSANDLGRTLSVANAHLEGYVNNHHVLQCTGSLPFAGSQNLGGLASITQLKHAWLQSSKATYGMPYSLAGTFFGGDAVIRSPDAFQNQKMQEIACVPVLQPHAQSRRSFEKDFECVAEKSSAKFFEHTRELVLDYDVFKYNCLAATRFITECAGGRVPQVPNLDVGGKFPDSLPVKFRYKDPEVISAFDSLFAAFETIDGALAIDLEFDPALSASDFVKTEEEKFNAVKETMEDAMQLLKNYPSVVSQSDRYWLAVAIRQWEKALGSVSNYRELSSLFVSLSAQAAKDFPSTYGLTVSDACHQIRSECGIGLSQGLAQGFAKELD